MSSFPQQKQYLFKPIVSRWKLGPRRELVLAIELPKVEVWLRDARGYHGPLLTENLEEQINARR